MNLAVAFALLVANAPVDDAQRCMVLRGDELSGSLSASSFGGGVLASGVLGLTFGSATWAMAARRSDDVRHKDFIALVATSAILSTIGGVIVGMNNSAFDRDFAMPCKDILEFDAWRERRAAEKACKTKPSSCTTTPGGEQGVK